MNQRYNNLPLHLKEYIVNQSFDCYTQIDHACWRFIMKISIDFFKKYAHKSYLKGLEATGITIDRIPSISDMDDKLQKIGWRAVPVRGFLPPTIFMQFQAHSILPIASDMRTVKHMTYTPAPDIVHEAAGHSPIIIDKSYSRYLKKYGQAANKVISSKHDHEVYLAIRLLSDIKENPKSSKNNIIEAENNLNEILNKNKFISEANLLARLNWWTVEYGLVGELKNPKIFGAGLLSSVGESYNAIYGNVKKIPLTLDCINYSYDITDQQPQLFVAENFDQLSMVLNDFTETMSFNIGGIKSLIKGIKSESVCTVKLDSGLQISGVLVEAKGESKEYYYRFSGPTQLSFEDEQLDGHGGDYHNNGFSSPICDDDIISALSNTPIGSKIDANFTSGINLKGQIKDKLIINNILLVTTFSNCLLTHQDQILFNPEWGDFDLACGKSVVSVSGGPADIESYFPYMNLELPNQQIPDYIAIQKNSKKNLIKLYDEIIEMGDKNIIDVKRIDLILKEIDLLYGDEWLIRYEIMKLLTYNAQTKSLSDISLNTHNNYLEKIESNLLKIAKTNKDLENSIKRALDILRT